MTQMQGKAFEKKVAPLVEEFLRKGSVSPVVSDEYMVSENIMAVTIVEKQYKKRKSFDLCPKCRKDFERFMKNE